LLNWGGCGGWGANGFASSFDDAQGAYYLQYGGRDPGVAKLNPPIVVTGNYADEQKEFVLWKHALEEQLI